MMAAEGMKDLKDPARRLQVSILISLGRRRVIEMNLLNLSNLKF